ncbi:MAG: sterol desaturase family protein [Ignavibacteriales bacterium]|nr:MAG: sterol desaturase family protein [Ignavibacteriales bacterium]
MPKNFVSNKDETVRMFESDFLESFSRVHPSVPVIVYLPVIAYFLFISIVKYELTFITIISLFALGVAVWTLTEYTLHRFIFHYRPKSKVGERLHFIFHGVHHDYPNDSRRLVMPPSVSVPLAMMFYFLFELILGTVLVAPFFVGFILGYLVYDMTHYAVHHFNMHNKFWLAIKNHHMRHHYMDSEKGFGVSSPTWDIIVGTDFEKNKK